MFSVLQTKFSAFSARHPVMCRVPYQVCVLAIFYFWFSFLFWDNRLSEFADLIDSAGAFLAAQPHSLSSAFFITIFCFSISLIVFIRELTFSSRGLRTFVLVFVLLVVSMVSFAVISHFPEVKMFWLSFSVAGLVQLGFLTTLTSIFLWNGGEDMFVKFGLRFASITFLLMYLLVITEACKKIF